MSPLIDSDQGPGAIGFGLLPPDVDAPAVPPFTGSGKLRFNLRALLSEPLENFFLGVHYFTPRNGFRNYFTKCGR